MMTVTAARYDLLKTLDKEVYDDLLERAIDISDLGYSDLGLDAIMVKLYLKDLKDGSIPKEDKESSNN